MVLHPLDLPIILSTYRVWIAPRISPHLDGETRDHRLGWGIPEIIGCNWLYWVKLRISSQIHGLAVINGVDSVIRIVFRFLVVVYVFAHLLSNRHERNDEYSNKPSRGNVPHNSSQE